MAATSYQLLLSILQESRGNQELTFDCEYEGKLPSECRKVAAGADIKSLSGFSSCKNVRLSPEENCVEADTNVPTMQIITHFVGSEEKVVRVNLVEYVTVADPRED